MAEITGEVQKGATEDVGRVDLKDDLGVEDQDLNEFRAVLKLGNRHKLRGSWISLDYDGDVVLDRLFIFDGTIFRQGERTIYADRMFYDVNREAGIVLGAEMNTPAKNFDGLLKLRAEDKVTGSSAKGAWAAT